MTAGQAQRLKPYVIWSCRYTRQTRAVAAFYQLDEDQLSSDSESVGLYQRQFSSMGTQTAMRDGSSQTCGQDLELEPHVPDGAREVWLSVQLLVGQQCIAASACCHIRLQPCRSLQEGLIGSQGNKCQCCATGQENQEGRDD